MQDYHSMFVPIHLMKVELKWYFKTSINIEFSAKENSQKIVTACSGSVY